MGNAPGSAAVGLATRKGIQGEDQKVSKNHGHNMSTVRIWRRFLWHGAMQHAGRMIHVLGLTETEVREKLLAWRLA